MQLGMLAAVYQLQQVTIKDPLCIALHCICGPGIQKLKLAPDEGLDVSAYLGPSIQGMLWLVDHLTSLLLHL